MIKTSASFKKLLSARRLSHLTLTATIILGVLGSFRVRNSEADFPSKDDFSLRQTSITLREIDLADVLFRDAQGYPRINWEKFQRAKPPVVQRQHLAFVLENRYVRVTLFPEMGRVYSLVSKMTAHEVMWTNKIVKPIPALNDTGWWTVLGGTEYTIPRGEHGTTWSLPWKYAISEDSPRRKAVRMRVLEPQTRIEQTLEISIYPDCVFYEAEISLTNAGDHDAKFSHWINPMWAPGGRSELTPETEVIVPCTAMTVLDRDFNRWMLGSKVQEYERNPLRFVKNWRNIGDLLAERLSDGFYGAFSHDTNEGVVRVFDPNDTPGMDIWTWGFSPPPERQRGYSEVPNLGYVEMWGGTSHDFSDEARATLAPKAERRWKEWMFPFQKTGGLTFANRDVAVNFKLDHDKKYADLAVFVTSPRQGLGLELQQGEVSLLRRKLNLSPNHPYRTRIRVSSVTPLANQLPRLILKHGRETLASVPAKLAQPVQWNFPYLSAEPPPTKR